MHTNPIIILEDDLDDRELLQQAFNQLGCENSLLFFDNGKELAQYLEKPGSPPLMIICDVNISGEDGFSVRERLEKNPQVHYKSVPFIFLSTAASEQQIRKAYDLHSQGFFLKASSFKQLKDMLSAIVTYWSLSEHPKNLSQGQ